MPHQSSLDRRQPDQARTVSGHQLGLDARSLPDQDGELGVGALQVLVVLRKKVPAILGDRKDGARVPASLSAHPQSRPRPYRAPWLAFDVWQSKTLQGKGECTA